VVDRERVDRLLARLAEDVRTLSRHRAQRAELLGRATELAAVKYHFITAIEGCTRIAHHLISSEGWPVAETNADALRRLGDQDVVEPRIASALANAVGFRNVLVHQYADVDDRRVVEHLEHLGDLEDFVREVARWVSVQP
jgi:uncharacterized protein YutE (UPF0331/DUF86 family)